nr:hypothetical protein CFP56_17673 [Quercus suber]
MDLVGLGKDFFLIRFGLKEDLDHVIAGGLWFIEEHFLSIRPWSPNFRPSTASVSSVAIWARLLELPIEYYHEDILKDIGASIGPVLRIDTHTASGSKGRYARVCVQVQDEKEAQSSPDTQPKPSMEEYGPWTVVSQRKSTTRNNSKGAGCGLSQSDTTSDSRWAKWPSWAYSADMIHIDNSKSASDGKRKAHYGDFGPSGVKSKDTWNSPSHKVTLAFATVSSNVPIPDMELKGGNFTFMTKGSVHSQKEICSLQAAFSFHGKKSSAPDGCRYKKHAA